MQEAGTKKENTKMVIVGFIGAVAVSALLVLIPLVQAVALNTQIMGLNKDIKKLSSIMIWLILIMMLRISTMM